MKELVVHIGSHKTGTTSIQNTLGDNDEAFLAAGLCYPRAARIGREGHHNLAYEVASSWRFRPGLGGWEAVEAELAGCEAPVALLSSESMGGFRGVREIPERAAALARRLGRRAVAVAALRPQWAYLESIYAQNAATGYTALPFARYVLETVAGGGGDYAGLLANWRETMDELRVIPFRPQSGVPWVETFLREAVGIGMPAGVEELRANERRGVRAVEFARKATEVATRAGADRPARTSLARTVAAVCAERWPDEPRFSALDRDLVKQIQKLHGPSNAHLFALAPHLKPAFQEATQGFAPRQSFVDLEAGDAGLWAEWGEVMLRAGLRTEAGAQPWSAD